MEFHPDSVYFEGLMMVATHVIRDDLRLLHNEHHCEFVLDIFFPHILLCPWISGFFYLQLFVFFILTPDLFTTGFKSNPLGNQNKFCLKMKEND